MTQKPLRFPSDLGTPIVERTFSALRAQVNAEKVSFFLAGDRFRAGRMQSCKVFDLPTPSLWELRIPSQALAQAVQINEMGCARPGILTILVHLPKMHEVKVTVKIACLMEALDEQSQASKLRVPDFSGGGRSGKESSPVHAVQTPHEHHGALCRPLPPTSGRSQPWYWKPTLLQAL